MDIGDAVLVEWVDACAQGGWVEHEDANVDLTRVKSVGIVFASDDTALTLALCVSDHALNGSITIPAGWIDSVKVLKRAVVR